MTAEVERVKYAVQRVNDRRSVHWIPRGDWETLVREDGEPTIVETCTLMDAVSREAQVVMGAASGVINNDPGMDIVRLDPQDAPRIYNVDHYTAIENLADHSSFGDILRIAGVDDTKALRDELSQYVHLVSPDKSKPHQFEIVPEHIRHARRRTGRRL